MRKLPELKTLADAEPGTFEHRLLTRIKEVLPEAKVWVELDNPAGIGHTLHVLDRTLKIDLSRILLGYELATIEQASEKLFIDNIITGLVTAIGNYIKTE